MGVLNAEVLYLEGLFGGDSSKFFFGGQKHGVGQPRTWDSRACGRARVEHLGGVGQTDGDLCLGGQQVEGRCFDGQF